MWYQRNAAPYWWTYTLLCQGKSHLLDEVLTTDWTYAVGSEGIIGGENHRFEIMTKIDGSPEKFKVEIREYD